MEIWQIVLIVIAGSVGLFFAGLILRALIIVKKRETSNAPRKNVDAKTQNTYAEQLSELIKCKTVYLDDYDDTEFAAFREKLKKFFPLVFEKAEQKIFGNGCIILKIVGKDVARNVMFMSHHDVVDAEGEWVHPPFGGEILNGEILNASATAVGEGLHAPISDEISGSATAVGEGLHTPISGEILNGSATAVGEGLHAPISGEISGSVVWGRGTVDTKTPLYGELRAVEELLSEGFEFSTNVYIGSSNNEEICGDGMPLAVEYFKKEGIHFELVSDEGGAIVGGMLPSVKAKSAMLAVHEKGRYTLKCVASAKGGHIGLNPSKTNPTRRMANFISEATDPKNGIFRKSFASEVAATFKTHAPYMAFPLRLIFASFGLFKPLLSRVLPKMSPQAGAMLQTNLYFTTIHGGEKEQIAPREVTAFAFFRCVRESNLRLEKAKIEVIAKKYGIELSESVVDYCVPSAFDTKYFALFKSVLNENFPDVIVSPFLLTAGSDARRFSDIADNIIRFAPIDLSPQQYASIHNINENIDVRNIGEVVTFYKDVIRKI